MVRVKIRVRVMVPYAHNQWSSISSPGLSIIGLSSLTMFKQKCYHMQWLLIKDSLTSRRPSPDMPTLTNLPWVSRNCPSSHGLTAKAVRLTEIGCCEQWSVISISNKLRFEASAHTIYLPARIIIIYSCTCIPNASKPSMSMNLGLDWWSLCDGKSIHWHPSRWGWYSCL